MAGLQSLGLHEPSALTYLVNEQLLPHNPPASLYKWDFQHTIDGASHVADEVLQTSNCVVWSRNGIVKRVFNLDIEGETITHAFTTLFEISSTIDTQSPKEPLDTQTVERALVVILKTQAHVFLSSGDTHVLPLSFEVQKAIPAPYGFLLQRNVFQTHSQVKAASDQRVPTNDTFSSLVKDDQLDPSHQKRLFKLVRGASGHDRLSNLPRTFAFSELLSELSLVVSGSLRKREPLDGYLSLSPDEDIIYISTKNEAHELYLKNSEQIYLAVTVNLKSANLTLWQVVFTRKESEDLGRKIRVEKPGQHSKRKSSNVYGRQTGAATPTARGPGTFRESIGGLAQPLLESGTFPLGRETPAIQVGDLATQLGHEFEQVGVQTRSARRVSSMLARTDLGGANDRSAFNDMALSTFGRKSFGKSLRRGESLGGFSDRQSFGTRRRSSFQAASSIYSEGTSFLDIPASHLLEDGAVPSSMDVLDELADSDTAGNLPRDVAFLKLKSLPYDLADGHATNLHSLKVTTMLAPDRSTADDRRSRVISVCIMDRNKQEMIIVSVAVKTALSGSRAKADRTVFDLKAVEVRRGKSIVDTCTVSDGHVKRFLILTRTRDQQNVIHLEAPWSVAFRVSIPEHLKIFDVSNVIHGEKPAARRDLGIRRIIRGSDIEIKGLQTCESTDEVLAYDAEGRSHRLRFQLLPSQHLVSQIIQLCNFVLAPEFNDSILVCWWEVKRWIESQGSESNLEWTAIAVTLFVLAVPFIGSLQSKPAQGPRRKKGGLLRSSSGTTVDLSQWDLVQEIEADSAQRTNTPAAGWAWMNSPTQSKSALKSPGKHSRGASLEVLDDNKTDPFLVRCTNLARDFLQSPAGENATGPEGYLPIAVNKERSCRRTALASILVGLHLLREELKLQELSSSLSGESGDKLALIIGQLASWLKWQDWRIEPGRYYYSEISDPGHYFVEPSVIDTLDMPAQPFEPPSIFQYVEKSIAATNDRRFLSLLDLVSQTRPIVHSHPLWKEAARITPRSFAITECAVRLNNKRSARSIIKNMLACNIQDRVLDTLPVGIAAGFQQAITSARGQSSVKWSAEMKLILGLGDFDRDSRFQDPRSGSMSLSHVHEALRDYRTISNNAIETESISRWDAFSELDRQAITRLIFYEDRRFQEASKLVNQTRPPVVQCAPEAGWSEVDLLEAQKELAVHVTRRTLSVSAGRAMMHFNARVPLLTERVPIPAFSLQCIMKAYGSDDNSQPMTLSADKALFTEEKVCWAFFHNGASAGLMISKDTRWIDTSWILYNKPPELTNRHAGFLLALGLNGHLKSLAKWVAFKYLTPKHTMTSVGLLLGLAASYLGTMDTLVARLLSVHVTRLLPLGAAELNLSPLTQTAGIIGVGLLYYNSQHRRMSEIMLSEIENNDSEERSGDEPILRDEGYRLAAGFSLGLINLGQGKKLHSLHDMGVVERLLTIAIGTKNVNLVHVLDRATAGAVIAVAFIFLKTNDETIAQKIDIPDTTHQFDYVRPDIFLLRTLARHLIMWDKIALTQDFIRASLPSVFRRRADLSTTKRLSTDDLPFFNVLAGLCFAISLRFAGSHNPEARSLLVTYLDQFLRLTKLPALNYDAKVTLNGLRNCLDVLALSCATVMAGSGDLIVMRRLRALHGRTDKDTPFGSHLAAHMALGVLFLSGGTATFGTGNLAVAALVVSLYPLFPVDVLDNKGHLQALRHLWVLAVEDRCLVSRDAETQQIISDITAQVELVDGTSQETQSPGLLPPFETVKKVSFRHVNYWPVEVDFDALATTNFGADAYPNVSKKASLSTRDYLRSRGAGLNLYLQHRTAYEKPDADTFFSELQALDEHRGVPSTDPNAEANEKWRQTQGLATAPGKMSSQNQLNWVFTLNAFKQLDFAEKALVMGDRGSISGASRRMMLETAVDSMLEFEYGCLGVDEGNDSDDERKDGMRNESRRTMTKNNFWQLRLLFDWADRWEREDEEDVDALDAGKQQVFSPERGSVRWIKKEVVEHLRGRVWRMAGGQNG